MEKRGSIPICQSDMLLIQEILSRGDDVCIQHTLDGGYRIVSQKIKLVRRHKPGTPVLRFGAAKEN